MPFVIETMRISGAVYGPKIQSHAPHLPRLKVWKVSVRLGRQGIWTGITGRVPVDHYGFGYPFRYGRQHTCLELTTARPDPHQTTHLEHNSRHFVDVYGIKRVSQARLYSCDGGGGGQQAHTKMPHNNAPPCGAQGTEA